MSGLPDDSTSEKFLLFEAIGNMYQQRKEMKENQALKRVKDHQKKVAMIQVENQLLPGSNIALPLINSDEDVYVDQASDGLGSTTGATTSSTYYSLNTYNNANDDVNGDDECNDDNIIMNNSNNNSMISDNGNADESPLKSKREQLV